LQSRHYDPEMGRFLNADKVVKIMKKVCMVIIIVIITILILLLLLPHKYKLLHPQDQIITVELLAIDNAKYQNDSEVLSIKYLSREQSQQLIENLQKAFCRKYFGDFDRRIGYNAIRITYSNGDVEVVGSYNNLYIQNQGTKYGQCYFDERIFQELITPYFDSP